MLLIPARCHGCMHFLPPVTLRQDEGARLHAATWHKEHLARMEAEGSVRFSSCKEIVATISGIGDRYLGHRRSDFFSLAALLTAMLLLPTAIMAFSFGSAVKQPHRVFTKNRCTRVPAPNMQIEATILLSGATAAVASADASLRYFAAGGLCAAISHSIATPIDVVKTRKQTVAEYAALSLPEGLGRVISEQGPAALFTGLGPTALGYGLEGALKFGAYGERIPRSIPCLVSSVCCS